MAIDLTKRPPVLGNAAPDWRDERPPYYRVNYGNGQVSDVFYGTGARRRADAYRARVPSGNAFVQWYDVPGGEWLTARTAARD